MTTTSIRLHRPAAFRRHTPHASARMEARASAQAAPRIGPGGRLLERLTRRWTVDLYDMDLQLESADLDRDLERGRR